MTIMVYNVTFILNLRQNMKVENSSFETKLLSNYSFFSAINYTFVKEFEEWPWWLHMIY